MMNIYDITVKDVKGEDVSLSRYKGKVLMVVNTATHCGFTPQYEGLQELYDRFHDNGLEILDFPCNQFGRQAPESDSEIDSFCSLNYHTSFPRFAKIDVNGSDESPLYTYLKGKKGGLLGNKIRWNFTKFLIDREGNVVERYGPKTEPSEIEDDIRRLVEETQHIVIRV